MAYENHKRKLTAILSADVSVYSRFMEKDGAATVSTPSKISSHRLEFIWY